jgi:hypothetical protein
MIWWRPPIIEHLTRKHWAETANRFCHIDGAWAYLAPHHFGCVRLLPADNDRDRLRW